MAGPRPETTGARAAAPSRREPAGKIIVSQGLRHEQARGLGREHLQRVGEARPVFRRGAGPGVVVVHEVPGITPAVLAFALEVVDAGFIVVMPSLVGTPGEAWNAGNVLSSMARVCVSREYATWSTGRTSPLTGWLRALAADLHAQLGGPGLGADLNLAPTDLASVKGRVAAGCPVLGLRYTGDKLVGSRFDTLRCELGEGFLVVELPGKGHSVVTEQRDEAAVQRVLTFFRERLVVPDPP